MGFGQGGQNTVALVVEPPVAADGEHTVLNACVLELSTEVVSSSLLPERHCLYAIIASSLGLRGDDAHIQRRQATRGIGNAGQNVRRAERWT